MNRSQWNEPGDLRVFIILAVILAMGLLSLYSVSPLHAEGGSLPFYQRQVLWIIIGLFFLAAVVFFDYHKLVRHAYLFYGIGIVLLFLVAVGGSSVQGAKRWLSLGPFRFQPSEFVKMAMILVWAKYFSGKVSREGLHVSQLVLPAIIGLIPLLLIIKQPDLGTALSVAFLFLAMVLLTGLRSQSLFLFLLLFSMIVPFGWAFLWGSLKEYQKERLLTFIDPTTDPLGRGYHLLQSKIAVGSGGIAGKGLLGGTQSQLKFLPEGHTDFIFSVFAEEWGFVGVCVLLSLYAAFLLWGLDVAFKAKDATGALIASGVVVLLTFHLSVNIGMAMGVMPVVGVPLPLMSYGGTSMVTVLSSVGLLLNVKRRRLELFY